MINMLRERKWKVCNIIGITFLYYHYTITMINIFDGDARFSYIILLLPQGRDEDN